MKAGLFFSCSEADWREIGTTVATGSTITIIFEDCSLMLARCRALTGFQTYGKGERLVRFASHPVTLNIPRLTFLHCKNIA